MSVVEFRALTPWMKQVDAERWSRSVTGDGAFFGQQVAFIERDGEGWRVDIVALSDGVHERLTVDTGHALSFSDAQGLGDEKLRAQGWRAWDGQSQRWAPSITKSATPWVRSEDGWVRCVVVDGEDPYLRAAEVEKADDGFRWCAVGVSLARAKRVTGTAPTIEAAFAAADESLRADGWRLL